MRASGFPNQRICDSWRVGLEEAGHADGDDRGGLGIVLKVFRGLSLAAGRQGAGRPQVPGGAALLHAPQHHLAGPAGRVRTLEQHLEALLAPEPGGRVRGLLRGAGGHESHRASGADQGTKWPITSPTGGQARRSRFWTTARPGGPALPTGPDAGCANSVCGWPWMTLLPRGKRTTPPWCRRCRPRASMPSLSAACTQRLASFSARRTIEATISGSLPPARARPGTSR